MENVGFGINIGDTILTDPGCVVRDCYWSDFPVFMESSMMMKEAAVGRKAGKQEGTVFK